MKNIQPKEVEVEWIVRPISAFGKESKIDLSLSARDQAIKDYESRAREVFKKLGWVNA